MAVKKKTEHKCIRSYLELGPTLDVGCAVGDELETLPPGSVGLEIAPEFIDICRKKGLNVIKADLNFPLPIEDESFQVVFCSHVLEHVVAPIMLLRELHRICKIDGYVVLGLPLESSWFDWRRRYFTGRSYHIYAFTPRNIYHMLKMVGLTAVKLWFNFPRVLCLFEKPLNWIAPFVRQLAPSYWIVAQKTQEATANTRKYSNEQLVDNWLIHDKGR